MPENKPVHVSEVLTPIYNRMTAMFYLMMRDDLPVGAVNKIVKSAMIPKETSFSDEILRAKAESMAHQMVRGEYEVPEIDALWSVRGDDGAGSMPSITPEIMAGLQGFLKEMQVIGETKEKEDQGFVREVDERNSQAFKIAEDGRRKIKEINEEMKTTLKIEPTKKEPTKKELEMDSGGLDLGLDDELNRRLDEELDLDLDESGEIVK
jgi:hypothetical protein